MKILAIEKNTPAIQDQELSPILLKEEARSVWSYHRSGKIREVYFRADRRAAVLILECVSVDEAKALLSSLPLVRAGSIEFELIPLTAYSGFERLFAEEA